jgi:HEPN domain-containing protein
MSAPDQPRLNFVEQWIRHASEDSRAAVACVRLDPPVLGSAACHCQQAAEKLLKDTLVLASVDFRKTRNLAWLGELVVAAFSNLNPFVMSVTDLSSRGIAYRYPGEAEPAPEPSVNETGEALRAIAALTEAVQSLVQETRDGSANA